MSIKALTKTWEGLLFFFDCGKFFYYCDGTVLTRRYLTSLGVRPNTKQLSFLGVPWTATYDDMSCKYSQYYVPVWYGVTLFLCMWSVVRHVVTLLVVIVRHHPRYCPAQYSLRILSLSSPPDTGPTLHSQINRQNRNTKDCWVLNILTVLSFIASYFQIDLKKKRTRRI